MSRAAPETHQPENINGKRKFTHKISIVKFLAKK
jgi:hypothetical protein